VATDPEVRVPFQALPDFLRSSGEERCPLSLLSTTEELTERKRSGSGLESEITVVGDPSRWLCDTSLSSKVGINFADKRGSWIQATEFFFVVVVCDCDAQGA
jgi:hypothetical protein